MLRAHAARKMLLLRENPICSAAEIAAVHADRSKSETLNSQVAGLSELSLNALIPDCSCINIRRKDGKRSFVTATNQGFLWVNAVIGFNLHFPVWVMLRIDEMTKKS